MEERIFNKTLSPEEILAQKELKSGFVYDNYADNKINKDLNVEDYISPKLSIKDRCMWKNIPLIYLPTKGDFYPDGAKIHIKPAEVSEIKNFSMIDENDFLDIEEKLLFILNKCCRFEIPGKEYSDTSYLDLKNEDKFYIIMSIRDITFINGENKILLKPNKKCKKNNCEQINNCPFNDGIELTSTVLREYNINTEIQKFYNKSTKSFIFNIDEFKKSIEIFIPSIGIMQKISNFITYCNDNNIQIDDAFIKISLFIFNDWRKLNNDLLYSKMIESDKSWSIQEFSFLLDIVEKIEMGTKLEVTQKCHVCGDVEVTADITFPDGIRSLFVIPNIIGKLFGNKI